VEPDKVTVMKPLSVEQVKKTIEEFKEISDRLNKSHGAKGGKTRPYYPLFIETPVDAAEIFLDEIDYTKVLGHINIEYHEQVDFILTVKGNAMSPFVDDGGLIFVKKSEPGSVRDEDIALFHIKEKEITLLRQAFFHRVAQALTIGVRSFNPRHTEWFPFSPEFITIQGKVVGSENDLKEVERLLASIERRT
jgi:phage repressor protein C with HTH and peptisase S24 domain